MKKIKIKGYIISHNDYYVGVCLTLNIVTTGKTPEETFKNLNEAIEWYIKDAIKNKEVKKFIPRYATLSYWIEYYKIKFTKFLYFPYKYFQSFVEYLKLQYA